jgi:hypothetical protein
MKLFLWMVVVISLVFTNFALAGEMVNEKDGRTFHQIVYQRSPDSKVAEMTMSKVMLCSVNFDKGTAVLCTDRRISWRIKIMGSMTFNRMSGSLTRRT